MNTDLERLDISDDPANKDSEYPALKLLMDELVREPLNARETALKLLKINVDEMKELAIYNGLRALKHEDQVVAGACVEAYSEVLDFIDNMLGENE